MCLQGHKKLSFSMKYTSEAQATHKSERKMCFFSNALCRPVAAAQCVQCRRARCMNSIMYNRTFPKKCKVKATSSNVF